jgi:hypothetical protein
MAPGQLTPVSFSSGSRSVSPQTPNGSNAGKPDEYFAPQIANNSPPPQQSRRPGGYGGFGDGDASDGSAYSPSSPKKQAPSLLQRMNTVAPGPFEAKRRPSARNAFPSRNSPEEANGFGGDQGNDGYRPPRAPRKDGYGGFGPPQKTSGDFDGGSFGRSDTFPRQSEAVDAPSRTPSEPGPRPDRFRRPSNTSQDLDGRPQMSSDRFSRPSRGPDTSRPPPPRTSLVRSPTSARDGSIGSMPAINLENEFGSGNPYHTPSESMSSDASGYSMSGASSQPSSLSSPPKSSASSRPVRKPSDTSSLDNLMSDLQSSMEELKPKELASILTPPYVAGRDKVYPMSPMGRRPPRPEFGYDPRIDPAVQNPRSGLTRSPGASPVLPEAPKFSPRDDPAIQGMRPEVVRRDTAPEPSPMPRPMASIPRPPSPPADSSRERSHSRSQSTPREPTRTRSRSRPRDPAVQSARGSCKSCELPITGKSISSADGRLTGRYHKACFVCTTCQNPFSSSTFYVLNDQPYCDIHYHELNGSLCGSCGSGIEGQYLEDEATKKHHVGCFKCGDCGMVLRDGYFEVNGQAFCEKDAWRRGQQPWMGGNSRNGPPRPAPGARGLPGANPRAGGLTVPGASSRLGPGPRPRMEKRMTRLGMM